MQKKITVTGANKVYFAVLIIFLFFSFLAEIIGQLLGKDITGDYFNYTILFTQFLMILTPVLIYVLASGASFKEVFRLNRLELLPAAIIILTAIPAIFVAGMLNSAVLFLVQFIGEIPKDTIPVPQNLPQLLAGIAMIGITPAICEEALHRGLLLKAYEKRGSLKAVFISAIMFGFFHFDITNLVSPIFLGILIGYYVLRTNSIFAGVLAHFLHNSVLMFFSYISRNEPAADSVSISFAELGQTAISGAIGLFFIFFLLRVFKRATESTAIYNPPISGIRNDLRSILTHWPILVSLILYAFMAALFLLVIFINKYLG